MSTVARFIGVDRYADPRIPDLAGATRDARALWALVSDSVRGIDAKALLDQEATPEGIVTAVSDTLDAARAKDTVILMFAGHGAPDHRIVAHG